MHDAAMTALLAERLTAVREKLSQWDVEGILITSAVNRRWLSGFAGSNAQLLITADQALLATDSRYTARIPAEAPHFTLFPHERTAAATRAFVEQAGVTRIGVEAKHLTLETFNNLQQLAGVQWTPLGETVESLRAVKGAAETAVIRTAAAITDSGDGAGAGARPSGHERAGVGLGAGKTAARSGGGRTRLPRDRRRRAAQRPSPPRPGRPAAASGGAPDHRYGGAGGTGITAT
jgi:Xaa-Pro aminopeptidase